MAFLFDNKRDHTSAAALCELILDGVGTNHLLGLYIDTTTKIIFSHHEDVFD